jgi:hypothetical protein
MGNTPLQHTEGEFAVSGAGAFFELAARPKAALSSGGTGVEQLADHDEQGIIRIPERGLRYFPGSDPRRLRIRLSRRLPQMPVGLSG